MRYGLGIAVLCLSAIASAAPPSGGNAPALPNLQHRIVDGSAVRFLSAETGGSARPRFITVRQVSFEARLLASSEDGRVTEPQDRHVRSAVELHVAIEMLSRLPLDPEPDAPALLRVARQLEGAVVDRMGGQSVLDAAADIEGFDAREIDSMFLREARAALYVERAISPVLYPTDDVLREVYRTTAHPFRGKKFEDAREPLARWFAFERLRAVETQYLQNARNRVTISYL